MADTRQAQWRTLVVLRDEVQIYPPRDLIGHELTEDCCVCGPSVELVKRPGERDAYIYHHHALDGRP